MVIIFKQSRQYSKAIEAFEKAISLNPKLERAHDFLEEIFDEMGKDRVAFDEGIAIRLI